MLENLFTNVFGRPKNRSSNNRSQDSTSSTSVGQTSETGSTQMTGPFSISTPQMPQPPNLPYPPAPYPSDQVPTSYYPSLPFSLRRPPGPHGSSSMPTVPEPQPYGYPARTLVRPQVSPLDSVPFEAKFTLNNSANPITLEQLFKEIKKAADVVDRADAYLKSNQSDYDFKTEQNLIYQ